MPLEQLQAIDQATSQNETSNVTTDLEQKQFFTFPDAKTHLEQLKSKWASEVEETKRRRLLREVNLSPKKLRDEGRLKADETIIPIRVIDTNINKEVPAYINYLKGNNRLAIFSCQDEPTLDTQKLESEFTTGMQFEDWELPHFAVLDGCQTHGWDSIEVVFDESKPLHCSIEQVGHDDLFFNLDAINNIQACSRIIRRHSFSKMQLQNSINDYGFNKEQVQILLDRFKSSGSQVETNIMVYKHFFKWEKIVYVAWFAYECNDWVKAPMPLFLGRKRKILQPVPLNLMMQTAIKLGMMQQPQPIVSWEDIQETEYPIVILQYKKGEQKTIVSTKGRVFYDEFKQEGQTAIASGYVNGLLRATNVYGSVDQQSDPSSAVAPKQIEASLEHGKLYDRKVDFWHTEYPDPSTLAGMQYFDTKNSDEANQPTFAVTNRQDSRKTAAEIQTANQQQANISGVAVVLYSSFLRKTYSICWLIVQSQALQGKINFLQIDDPAGPQIDVIGGTGQATPRKINDVATIGRVYVVKPAGDVDVIQRQELQAKMKNDWPVFGTTPLATIFLAEYIKLAYPQQADKWIPLLLQGDPKVQLIQHMAGLLTTIPHPEELKANPQMASDIQQTLAAAQQVLGNGQANTQQTAPTTQ